MKTINQNTALTLVEQFNLGHLCNGRAPLISGGWSDVRIDPRFRESAIDAVISLLNIRKDANAQHVRYKLRNEPLHTWFANRFVYVQHNGVSRWQYVAGQDYTTEIANIRRELYK